MICISVDVEASGPVPGLYNLVSVGACAVRESGGVFTREGASFYVELEPAFPGFIDEAMAVHGITREKLEAEGVSPRKAMSAFRDWIMRACAGEKSKPVFVGHNAAFDWAYVNYYFHHFSVDNPFDIFPMDTKALAFARFDLAWDQCRKSHFIEIFPALPKIDERLRHRADYDAEFQAMMLCEIMNRPCGRLEA